MPSVVNPLRVSVAKKTLVPLEPWWQTPYVPFVTQVPFVVKTPPCLRASVAKKKEPLEIV
jgi:hypothetical protein